MSQPIRKQSEILKDLDRRERARSANANQRSRATIQQSEIRVESTPIVPRAQLISRPKSLDDWAESFKAGTGPSNEELQTSFAGGFDWGTTTSSFCLDLIDPSGQETRGKVKTAEISTAMILGHFRVPSEVGIRTKCPALEVGGPPTCELVFGQEAQKEAGIKEDHVFRFIKYAMHPHYNAPSTGLDGATPDKLLKEVQEQHNALLTIINEEYNGIVVINNGHTRKQQNINSVFGIIVAFLKFMLKSIKQELASRVGIQLGTGSRRGKDEKNRLKDIFKNKFQVAASVPAAWSTESQDLYLDLLFAAGFPRSTILLNETTSAIRWHFNELTSLPQSETKSEDLIVIDIGGATVEGAAVRKYVKDGKEEFVRTIKPASSWNGALNLITMFRDKIQNYGGDEFWKLEGILRQPDELLTRWLWDSFDLAKRTFDNQGDKGLRLRIIPGLKPTDISIPTDLRKYLKFSSKNDCFFLANELVKAIFDEWLNDIVNLILQFIMNLNDRCAESRPWVALCGWGSLPPYVLNEIRRRLAQKRPDIKVKCIESRVESIVAQGNFINLIRQDLFSWQIARQSYGVVCDMPINNVPPNFDHNQAGQTATIEGTTYLLQRVLWVVEKGTEVWVSGGSFPQAVQGTKIFTERNTNTSRSMFPLSWNIDLVVSRHDSIANDDTYRFNSVQEIASVSGAEIRQVRQEEMHGRHTGLKSHLVDGADNTSSRYVKFDFRVRMDFQGQIPKLVLCIPRRGKFQSQLTPEWTEKEEHEDCRVIEIEVRDLFTHANSRRVIEAQFDAGWLMSDSENGATEEVGDLEMEDMVDGEE